MKSGIRFTLQLLVIIILIYSIHKGLFLFFKLETKAFKYNLEESYLIFSTLSGLILFILYKVRQKNLDIVGYTFLLLTTIKMVVCYIFSNNFSNEANKGIEKWNFFFLFIVFLVIETFFTAHLLNSKNTKKEV
jgi:membrane protease YdiL (CAAX protease family)